MTSGTAELETALHDADLPSLLPALAQVTGDLSILREELRPSVVSTPLGVEPQGGLSQEAQEQARRLAASTLRSWAGRGRPSPEPPSEAGLRRMMEFITGPMDDEYLPLLRHQLGLTSEGDTAAWHKSTVAPDRTFRVVIIGAGMSGLAAAHQLRSAGIPFVVVERNDEVGGVWWQNRYPGCRLDTSNYSYSYSFAQRPVWPHQYSTRESILEYFRQAATDLGLRESIRLGTRVLAATFDEACGLWRVRLQDRDGRTETLEAEAVISAVGQLNEPAYPAVPGRDRFRGPSWHTARWNAAVDLTGRRVAVIGTGASAFQVVPEIAEMAAELLVFQRTPPWIMPTPAYRAPLRPGLRHLLEHVPHYHRWFRFQQFWNNVEGRRRYCLVDPEWREKGSVSALNHALREALVAHLEREYDGRPDLLAKAVPEYPPYAKRMLRDDGAWARTLKRDDVTLISEPIAEIAERGVVTAGGTLHEADVIIYGTGFQASMFLPGMTVTGRGGADLHRQWAGDPRAHIGITVPNFPNLFLLYGPNTNLVVNGSIVMFSELEVNYVLECLKTLLQSPYRTMECRQEALDGFCSRVDEASARMAFGLPGVRSWYKNAAGRVTQNWPLTTLEFWRMTRRPEPGDYEFS
ncbi:NAD(P)-binding domain-containing protein [Actinomadura sp. SCN-SB]|uniref:NAD(P)-binding domain-containing protein n=1 Tax=Actinomadura sp. SCN-SB TaxID=3373092 RepID=UPI003750C1A0